MISSAKVCCQAKGMAHVSGIGLRPLRSGTQAGMHAFGNMFLENVEGA
jgi:hypothetical protein